MLFYQSIFGPGPQEWRKQPSVPFTSVHFTSQLRKKSSDTFYWTLPGNTCWTVTTWEAVQENKDQNKQWGKASTPEPWPQLQPLQTHHNTAAWATQDSKVCKRWGKYVLCALSWTLHRWKFLLPVCLSIFLILFSFIFVFLILCLVLYWFVLF